MHSSWSWASVVVLSVWAAEARPQTYTIKLKTYPDAGMTMTMRETFQETGSNRFFDAAGKLVNEMKPNKNREMISTFTMLEKDKSETPQRKYQRTFEKASEVEDGKRNVLSYQGRTVVFERKNSAYHIGVVGKPPLESKDLDELLKKVNDGPSPGEGDRALIPAKPVAVGEHWSIDPKKLGTILKDLDLDPKATRAEATLQKVYTRGKSQFGVLELTLKLACKGIGPILKFDPPATMEMKATLDTAIDGTSTARKETMAATMKGKGIIQQGPNKITVDMVVEMTSQNEISEEKDDAQARVVPPVELIGPGGNWEEFASKEGRFTVLFGESVKARVVWQVPIGSWSGSPVVHRGYVLIGTNNTSKRDPAYQDLRGVLMCFDQNTGAFLGQVTHAKLPHRSNDLPGLGICCRPCVEENRAYYVSNRGELVCLDLDSFAAGVTKPTVGKVRWSLDMVGTLGVFKRDASDIGNPLSSPIIINDLVYCVTGNGSAFGFALTAVPANSPYVPKPDAPSFLAVNKMTGAVVWRSTAPGKNIQYGQWGSPAQARVAKVVQVLFPGGDGWLYGFEARTGQLVWKVDCNLASATRWDSDKRGTRTAFLAAPVIRAEVAYIGAAVDLEMIDIPRPLYAIDLTHKGDATRQAIKWTFCDKHFGGTLGAVALGKDTLYALGDSGILVCLDPATGNELWRSDLGLVAQRFNSPIVQGDKVIVGASEKLFLFQDARQRKPLGEFELQGEIMGSPTLVNNRIYVATSRNLYCLEMLLTEK